MFIIQGVDVSKVYNGKSKLKKDRNIKLLKAILGFLVIGFMTFLFIRIDLKWYIALSVSGVSFIYSSYNIKRYRIISSGVNGENDVRRLLKSLPSNYTVFNNLLVPSATGRRELDLVVVGDNGIFVVEVKNHKGVITGNAASKTLTQNKRGQNGGDYSKPIDNPLIQLKSQMAALGTAVRKKGIQAYVDGMVYFCNEDCTVRLSGDACNVTDSEDVLIKYIKSSTKNKLSRKDKENTENLLKGYLQ